MKPFPEEYELIEFFESEPELTDKNVPWIYNRLIFETQRNGNTVVCAIEPGNRQIDLTWKRSEKDVASFELREISSLKIQSGPGDEFMTVTFRNREILEFVFYLKPYPMVRWGNLEAVNA